MPGRLSLRVAAVAAVISAVTTFLLWYLPQLTPEAATPAAKLALRCDPAYMARLWDNFFHVLICLYAYGAAASLFARRSVTLAATGFVAFAFWAFTEAVGVAVNLFAVNAVWRKGLAEGAPDRAALQAALAWFPPWWDALFFVLLIFFLIGTTAFGAVAVAGKGLERIVGILFLAGTPLTLLILMDGYFGWTGAEAKADWVYPFLQPVSRATLGVWLWREASRRPV